MLWMMVMDTYIYPTTHLQYMKDTYTYSKAFSLERTFFS
jgi:hypothetical protein